MQGAARALFVPLSLAVGFAMIASYILSSTFVPILSVWLLRRQQAEGGRRSRGQRDYARVWPASRRGVLVRLRWLARAGLPRCSRRAASVRRRPATRHRDLPAGRCGAVSVPPEGTHRHAHRADRSDHAGSAAVHRRTRFAQRAEKSTSASATSGVVHSAYPINTVYLWMGGPEESVIRVALKPGKVRIEDSEGPAAREAARSPAEMDRRQVASAKACPRHWPNSRVADLRLVVRAGRHRQRGDELRLALADRGAW